MSRLAEKINQLNLIQTQFGNLGQGIDAALTSIHTDKQKVEHYRSSFKDRANFDNMIEIADQLEKLLIQYKKVSIDTKNQVSQLVGRKERHILQADYARYESENISAELLEKRFDHVSDDIKDALMYVTNSKTDWVTGAVDVYPVNGHFTKHLISCDPLYVIINSPQLLPTIKNDFNEFYRDNRLRVYNSIDNIPNNQLGFATCINNLEYMPLDYQGKIFEKVYAKLQPGGQMLITYNDCEKRAALEHTLSGLRCYSTKSLTIGKASSYGFDIVDQGTTNNGVWSWALLQKFGKYKTIKRSAPMVVNQQNKLDI